MKQHPLAVMTNASKWIKGSLYKDDSGRHVNCCANPVAFCSIGVIEHVSDNMTEFDKLADRLEKTVGGCVGQWNDLPERTWEEVRAAFVKTFGEPCQISKPS